MSPGASSTPRAQKRTVVALDEAVVLAFGLLGHDQAQIGRDHTHLRLRHGPQRQHEARQLLLAQQRKHVALVLARIQGSLHHEAPRIGQAGNARVVARGDAVAPQFVGYPHERGHLAPRVATHARTRREARRVRRDERLHHAAFELAHALRRLVANAQLGAHGRRIGRRALGGSVVAKAARDAHHLVPGAHEQRRRNRAVHPAAHSERNAPARIHFRHSSCRPDALIGKSRLSAIIPRR